MTPDLRESLLTQATQVKQLIYKMYSEIDQIAHTQERTEVRATAEAVYQKLDDLQYAIQRN